MLCSVLQCVAVCCSVYILEVSADYVVRHRMCYAVCCSVWQCVAVCYSVLQCVYVTNRFWSCLAPQDWLCSVLYFVAVDCCRLQCVAVCCSVLQRVAACCSVLQRVAACCSVDIFQVGPDCVLFHRICVAVCCSVLCLSLRRGMSQINEECYVTYEGRMTHVNEAFHRSSVCHQDLLFVLKYVAVCCKVVQCVAVYIHVTYKCVCRIYAALLWGMCTSNEACHVWIRRELVKFLCFHRIWMGHDLVCPYYCVPTGSVYLQCFQAS